MKFLILLGGFLFFCYMITKPVRNIFDALTGDTHSRTRRPHDYNNQQSRQQSEPKRKARRNNDIIDSGEGEYIDYEEVKDQG